MYADVRRGSRQTGLYVISILSCSKIFGRMRFAQFMRILRSLRMLYAILTEILRKPYAFVRDF